MSLKTSRQMAEFENLVSKNPICYYEKTCPVWTGLKRDYRIVSDVSIILMEWKNDNSAVVAILGFMRRDGIGHGGIKAKRGEVDSCRDVYVIQRQVWDEYKEYYLNIYREDGDIDVVLSGALRRREWDNPEVITRFNSHRWDMPSPRPHIHDLDSIRNMLGGLILCDI